MALSLNKNYLSRNKSPSRSPLSPTIIHYRQTYSTHQTSSHHQDTRRHQHHNRRAKRSLVRQPSSFNSPWEVHRSSNGQSYYYNVVTDQSQWEKPPKEQLSSVIPKQSISSKRTSKKFKRSPSSSIFVSKNDLNSSCFRSSSTDQRSFKSTNRTKSIRTAINNRYHSYRRETIIKQKSSLKNSRTNRRVADELPLLTPTSPPAHEKIHIDLVDPILTSSSSATNTSTPAVVWQEEEQANDQLSPSSLDQIQMKTSDSKQFITRQINANLSSTIIQSSLCPSESTINAILQLGHSSPSVSASTNCDHITRYYRAELIEHLLNWPSTQIEREAKRSSNEQMRYITCQLASLRTDLFSIRLQLRESRFRILKYHYILLYQKDLLSRLERY